MLDPTPAVARSAPVLVEIRNLAKYYRRGDQIIPVLVDIDLDVMLGDFVALMGPSGSGKTTLLNLIAGIDKPSGGTIKVDGVDIAGFSDADLAQWRACMSDLSFSSTTCCRCSARSRTSSCRCFSLRFLAASGASALR